MGLDVSHDAWRGAYSAFMRWRQHVAEKAGLPPLMTMEGFTTDGGITWSSVDVKPELRELLFHSDCDGEIAVEHLDGLASELERLADLMADEGDHGHIRCGMRSATLRFAAGCRAALAAGEPLDFH